MINSFKIGGCPQILHPHGSPWAMIGLPSLHPGPQAFSCCGTWDASEAKKVSRPGRLEPAPMKSPWKKGENQWLKYQIQPTNNVQTWRMGKHMLSDYLDLFGSIWIFGVPQLGSLGYPQLGFHFPVTCTFENCTSTEGPIEGQIPEKWYHADTKMQWLTSSEEQPSVNGATHVRKKNQELSFQHIV